MTLIALAHPCVAIVRPASSSIHVLAVFVHIDTRQVLKVRTIKDGLFGEIRAQMLRGGIQPAWLWHHVCCFDRQSHDFTAFKIFG